MPTYVILVNWTDQVHARTSGRPASGPTAVLDLAQKHGLKFEQAYWTVGPYDMVAIFTAPDDEAMSAHLLEIGFLGSVRTTALRAARKEMSRILQRFG